ncbi:MAG: ABC transporter substrate-binding protein [Pseudoclavibacter sp.]
MNIRKGRRALLSGVALASAAALALTGCARGGGGEGGEASPGITDDSITLGITTPLSGGTAGPGNCTVDGITAYFGGVNADGGVTFGDGQTRQVNIEALDDQYDPQQARANYDQLKGEVFAMTSGLGTPTNRAYLDAAISDEVPQVLVQTGDPIFSDREGSPWQLGFVPIYQNEGQAFGELLAGSDDDLKVAILSQNDDFGEGYVEGFKTAVEGSANIEIVGETTYEATDTNVNAQITELAATDADVIFNAMSITPLVITAMEQAKQLGWSPSWFQPSNTSSPGAILEPAGADAFPGVYSVSFAKAPASPEYDDDEDVQKFLDDIGEYTSQEGVPQFPHCMWSYMVGATLQQAFESMTEPTRANFMENLMNISDFQAPLMLDGTAVNTTEDGQPAVSSVIVQKYNGTGFDNVESFG